MKELNPDFFNFFLQSSPMTALSAKALSSLITEWSWVSSVQFILMSEKKLGISSFLQQWVREHLYGLFKALTPLIFSLERTVAQGELMTCLDLQTREVEEPSNQLLYSRTLSFPSSAQRRKLSWSVSWRDQLIMALGYRSTAETVFLLTFK